MTSVSAGTGVEMEVALDAALADAVPSGAGPGGGGIGRLVAELDAAEEFPAPLVERLDAFGLPAYYVPAEWGGVGTDHELLLRLWRTVARRDLSATIAHGKTYLGAAPVWCAGDAEQASTTAAAILAGEQVAWALSEPDHGADLLNGTVTATAHDGGYRLDGVKWPINNATRARYLTVLARTGAAGTGRGQSLFLVDKTALAPGTWRVLPKESTHGIRGIDISGIAFEGAALHADALLGREGTGLETVLHALQLTRTMCAALSLGAGEHALRIAAAFAAERIVQRRPLLDRSHPRALLGRCAALMAAAEASALVGSRSLHSLTGEMSVVSAVVKSVAPELTDAMMGELAELLGVRSFLTGVYAHGSFQKIWRDHQIVSVFDGSTPVNRAALVQQFPRLVREYTAGSVDEEGLAEAASAGDPPRPLDRGSLTLLSRRGCSVVQSIPALSRSLASPTAPAGLAAHAVALEAAAAEVHALMAAVTPAAHPPMAAYEIAAAYELCYAAAACLHAWSAGRHRHDGEPLWEDGLWVRAALRALRARLAVALRSPAPVAAPGDDRINDLLAQHVARAARTGAPMTPFGAPMSRSGEGRS
ncbi:acyl-CoA dehydrogenase family protein [Streptomyces sp. NBC_00576]|uniref:acyl-CoA dehydrogenase family protein n=1 Tax=Streptomyces sp. NBC_00576 TaxID=2903665 RepID=UPI002E8124E3|nr:acyl-CoA dehydrogenase family protein [Streptomyces sp. NBC_00576]WUB68668.1 acyl-CoA/acyl-ACP dehydrogenase [Streptomyces sp. NBC_00576]WUB77029.1 acyl-CoA/acyl-ACP dehydrogenase [Streptomyces sp. NBC_00576]